MSQPDHITPVFKQLRGQLFSVAKRMLGNDEEAADAVQDTFVRLWLKRDSLCTTQQAQGTAVTAVRHTAIDYLRRRAAHPTAALSEQPHGEPAASAPVAEQDREAVYREVNALVETALTEQQRTIIRLRDMQGLEFDEIARQLGMQPPAVRVQLSRARKRLRELSQQKHSQS